MDNKNTEVFSTESSFLTAEMLAALWSDVLHDRTDQHGNGCLKNARDGQTAMRDGQRFEPPHLPRLRYGLIYLTEHQW